MDDVFEVPAHHNATLETVATAKDESVQLAPEPVRRVVAGLPPEQVEIVSTSPESDGLRKAYLEAAVVWPASSNDAAHIA